MNLIHKLNITLCILLIGTASVKGKGTFQEIFYSLEKVEMPNGVTLTIDEPKKMDKQKTCVVIYALPNGNSTAWTFGKELQEGDDWHFDIQHIGAQTRFVRNANPQYNYVVVYAENSLRAWPSWRRQYADSNEQIKDIVAHVKNRYQRYEPEITLAGHSGGGSFIFGYINSQEEIPHYIKRIGFLDATYAYETDMHNEKLASWLDNDDTFLEVISYNDSVVIYNGKPLVSPTGGTWYRSKLMAKDLNMDGTELDSIIQYRNKNAEILLLKNPDGEIFHTVLVEKNGFIHTLFINTPLQSKEYRFWEDRAYTSFILP